MDITLIKTFLEVAATGSFVSASDRLFVTQSAVSLRIQRLEDTLGRPLFTRSKAGAELTPAGKEFEAYAISMIKLWEEARQQVAIPEGFTKSLVIGAQYSLWPKLGFRWMDRLQEVVPDLSLRAEVGMPDRLTRFLVEGVIQVGLVYTPTLRPGLAVEKLLEDELVMVTSTQHTDISEVLPSYVFVDWGPEFVQAHSVALPTFLNTGTTLSLGAMAVQYILERNATAYVPARAAQDLLEEGRFRLVADAPKFPYPIWAVWREDLDPELRQKAGRCLHQIAKLVDGDQEEIIEHLAEISEGAIVERLGAEADIMSE